MLLNSGIIIQAMKIALIILVFEDHERLEKHLALLKKQTRKPDIIIVNTGSKPIAPCKGLKCKIYKSDNLGIAAGFNEGIRKAVEQGYDYVILADDDSYPVKKDLIGIFWKHAEKGTKAVAGFYPNGRPICHSNQYFMIRSELFSQTGFYFTPFFTFFEDSDIYKRVEKLTRITHDPEIILDHHVFTPNLDLRRTHLFFRSGFISSLISYGLIHFISFFYSSFFHALFVLFFHRSSSYLVNFLNAITDFLLGNTGDVQTRRHFLLKACEPPHSKTVILYPTDSSKLPSFLKNAEIFKEEVPYPFSIRTLKGLSRAIDFIFKAKSKTLVVAEQFHTAYPPLSLLTKDIFLYDTSNGRCYHFYKNNVLLNFLLSVILPVFLVPLLLPIPVILYFIKKRYYLSMYRKEIESHIGFYKKFS